MVALQAKPAQSPPERPPRRYGRWLLLIGLLLVTAAGADFALARLTSAELFPLRTVELEGRLEHVAEAELRQAIAAHLNGGLLGLDVERIRRAVESLPWVDLAAVRRVWPGTLVLRISEQQALGRWGEAALVNHRGEVFRPLPDSFPAGLPQLAGAEGSAGEVVERYTALQPAFGAAGFRLSGLAMDARRSWSAQLDGRVRLELGSERVTERVQRFLRSAQRLPGPEGGRLERVDLRYPNGFAVAWAAPEQKKTVQGN